MNGAGEDFCNGGMIAMLKYSNHFYSHPVRVSKIVKKGAWKSRFALPLGGDEKINDSKPRPICCVAADLQSHSLPHGAEAGEGDWSRKESPHLQPVESSGEPDLRPTYACIGLNDICDVPSVTL